MKRVYVVTTALALLASCRSIGYDDLNPNIQPNPNLLPVLTVKTDTTIYPKTYKSSDKKKVDDRRANDAANLLRSDAQKNLMEQSGENKGYISMRVSYEDLRNDHVYTATKVLGIIPLGIPLFLGVPFGGQTQDVELEVQIMNKKRDIIKQYTATCTGSAVSAVWWGYSTKDTRRKASTESIKQAMESIRRQINNDAPEIRAQLK